jgi:hypothetical protein
MAELQQDLATAPPPVAASGPNVVEDEPTPLQPSGDRPPPARGILKNPIRGGSMSEGARGDQ